MKTSLLILCVLFASAFAAPAMAADQTQPTPHKTLLKKTNHSALCNTPQGKLRKECTYNVGAQSVRH